jgi:condensin complex subunit 2
MPKSRKEKKNFQVDFVTAAEKDLKTLSKELFAPIGRGASINLPATTSSGRGHRAPEKKDDHQLPNDMHFSSRELVTLFLKPKFSVSLNYVSFILGEPK